MSEGMKLTRRKAIKITDAQAGKMIFGTKHSMAVTEDMFSSLYEKISGGLHSSHLVAGMTELNSTLVEAFKMGGTVHVPKLGVFRVTGRGTEDPSAEASGKPIVLKASLLLSRPMKTLVATQGSIPYSVVDQAQIVPVVTSATDVSSDLVDQSLTPGGQLDIKGTNLKFNNTKIEQGVYLIPTDPAGTPVKFGKSYPPTNVRLQMTIPPELVTGATYRLEIRTCTRGTQNLRIGRYSPIFTVA